ncbi:MAG: DUF1385 domain-containing protein [Chloroflexi bacterium]|nr:DUF1385 domain-containing protein [Chloroflexota bacterium]
MATKRFYYGGQAVVEGVMMRGRQTMATAVRRPDGGLAIDTHPLPRIYTGWLRKTPLIRGVIVLIEALVLGINALLYSANVSLEEEEEKLSSWQLGLIVAVSMVFAVGVFFIVPLFLTRLFHLSSSLLFNLVDGIFRVVILVIYLKLMTLVPDIKRTFAYHGAEHAVVNAYESGVPIELEAVRGHSKEHVRCGTSFIFVVMVISVFVFALVGVRSAGLMVLSRVVLIPVIASLSYEIIYFGSRHIGNPLVRAVLTPGLWLQSLTTREPDDSQLEVAIAALGKVVEVEEKPEAVNETGENPKP